MWPVGVSRGQAVGAASGPLARAPQESKLPGQKLRGFLCYLNSSCQPRDARRCPPSVCCSAVAGVWKLRYFTQGEGAGVHSTFPRPFLHATCSCGRKGHFR